MDTTLEVSQEEYNEQRLADLKSGVHTPEYGPRIRLAAMSDLHLKRTVALSSRHRKTSEFWAEALKYFKAEVTRRQ